jgi:hypothetical protein
MVRPRLRWLEDRSVPAVTGFGVNSQHTGLSTVASQPMEAIHWSTPVENYTGTAYQHIGGPVITDNNTVIYPFRTNTSATPPNFRIVARNGNDGSFIWDAPTDWNPVEYGWFPPLQPAFVAATNRVYYPGAGGTIYYRDNVDSAAGSVTQLAFWGGLQDYLNNKSTFDAKVHIESAITPDSQGNVYFGFRVTGTNPAGLVSGIAKVTPAGVGSWVSVQSTTSILPSGVDTNIDWVHRYSAFALSNNESTLYLAARDKDSAYYGRLIGIKTSDLSPQYVSGVLKDPRNGGLNNANISSSSTSAPMVAPDGKVFYGVLPSGGSSRGWMLQFSGDLQTQYTPGGFGWDNTASIVPSWMVPQYTGSSSYLIFTKYNNYYQTGGADMNDGSNRIAVLDPNDTEVEFHPSSNGQLVMKRVLEKLGPTPDWLLPGVPTAVREWCINYATVDPFTSSILVNSSDGKFYRWHLPTDTLIEPIQLTAGELQPYTMTVVGVDGTVYGIQIGQLFAFGKTPGLSVNDVSVTEGTGGTVNAVFTVSLDFPRTTPITVNYATANETAQAGSDYTHVSGTLTFNPGEKTKTVTVTVLSDALNEVDETFVLNLSMPTGAVIVDGQGRATIINDDPVPSLSIADVVANETNSGLTTFQFAVTLSAPSGQVVTVNYATADGTATLADNDYQMGTGTITFQPGETLKMIGVAVVGDTKFEPNETFFVNLTSPANAALSDDQGQGTITNDDGVPSLAVNDVSVPEGAAAMFLVSLSNASSQTITVNYATAPGTATTADFVPAMGVLTFLPGETVKPIIVNTIDDALNELQETFFINIANPVNGFIGDGQGIATILDDDPEPMLAIGDASVYEGASGTTAMKFAVTLSSASGRTVTVNYATADGSAKVSDNDYQPANGTIAFAEGETVKLITVLVNGDLSLEPDEDFFVNLTSPDGALISDGQGRGLIIDDDSRLLSIGDKSVTEGDSGATTVTLNVILSSVSPYDVAVQFYTADGTAQVSDGDYVAYSDTITFKAGETAKSITLIVNGDTKNEADELFFVFLQNAVGATIADGQGNVTILNDDPVPTFVLDDVSAPEGDYLGGYVNVYVKLSAVSGQVVTVDYQTVDGTATSTGPNADYVSVQGTLTFLPGETSRIVQVPLLGDYIDELDEYFWLQLSAPTNASLLDSKVKVTLLDEDTAVIGIGDQSVVEGNSGKTDVQLTISLTAPSDRTITVEYTTADETATVAVDYEFGWNIVTFLPGETSKTITLHVFGDTVDELDESFRVQLYNPTGGALVGYYDAKVTILDDDPGTPAKVSAVVVNGGAVQRSRVNQMTVQFNQFVNLPTNPASAFQLKRQGDNAPVTLGATVDNSGPGTQVHLTFVGGAVESGSLADGLYTLTIDASQVTTIMGHLDGDNDGLAGGDYVVVGSTSSGPRLFRLFGDSDGNGSITAVDFAAFRLAYGLTGASIFDINGDHQVTAVDFSAFRLRYGLEI